MFYNTTNENNRVLAELRATAAAQEEKVFRIIRQSRTGLTASEVFQNFPDKRVPLTSIRRAITNLKDRRKVVKTTLKKDGIYGRPEYVYQLYTGQTTLFSWNEITILQIIPAFSMKTESSKNRLKVSIIILADLLIRQQYETPKRLNIHSNLWRKILIIR